MTTHRVVVATAGMSQPSSTRLLADRLAAAVTRSLAGGGDDVVLEVVELREHARDITTTALTGFPGTDLRSVLDSVARAGALVVVTPIFSGSYSGLFKLFFDVLDPTALVGTPVLIGATAGTARHSLALEHALRPLFSYLRAVVVPTGVFAASEDWGSGGAEAALSARVDRAADELAALLRAAPAPVALDPFEHVTPFGELLSGGG